MEKMEGKMNKMEKNSSEKLLRQLIATLRMEGSLVSASLGESDKYNIIVINGESLTGEYMGNSLYNSECKRKSGKELENIISKKLIGFGIPTRLKGYKYMLSAIEQVLEDETSLEGVTKILYPDVAKKYNSTPQRVEKAIRHAIEVAWTDNGVELRREFQDRKENKRPTNSEFISRISAYIKMSA